jgi:hypothetical protein
MNAARIVVVTLALAAAFGLGRFTLAPPQQTELSTVASFREALEDRDWLTRTYRLSAFLQGLNPDNLPEALEAFEASARYLSEEEYRLFMLAWSRFDAQGAFDRALFWPEHSDERATEAAITAWAFLDPPNARLALRRADEEPSLKRQLQSGLVVGSAQRDDKRDVIEYVTSLDSGLKRQRYTNLLAAKIMEHEGAEGVKKWADEIPVDANAGYKRTVFDKAANVLAAVDPPGAAQWIDGYLDNEYAGGAPVLIVRRWVAAGEPVAALEWALTLDDGSERDDAVKAGFNRWLQTDEEGARAWLDEVAPAPGLDVAVRAIVRQTIQDSPETAMGWAQRIHDPDLRYRVVVGVGNRWLFKDTDAANAWLAESGLPEETKAAISNPVRARAEKLDDGSERPRRRGLPARARRRKAGPRAPQ